MSKTTLKGLKELGIKLPPVKVINYKVPPAQGWRLIKFAVDHDFVISPMGYGYYAASFAEFRCCPCAPERKACPCEEAAEEVLSLGKCKCQLYWRDYATYLAEKFKKE